MNTTTDIVERARAIIAKYEVAEQTLDNAEQALSQAERAYQNELEAREVLKQVALSTQAGLEFQISSLVTAALAAVFPDPYEFKIKFVERRNRTECDVIFSKNGEDYDPKEASGGGPLDVASLALRLAYWSLRRNRRTFVLDEPFKHVSAGRHEKVSSMLKMLSTQLGIQIIMVTHSPKLVYEADAVFHVQNGHVTEDDTK